MPSGAPTDQQHAAHEQADPAFRRVHLRGLFDAEHSVLLDNRMRDGKAGVELLQPFTTRPAASGCCSIAAGCPGRIGAGRLCSVPLNRR